MIFSNSSPANDADAVIIAPVYPAGEQPIPGVDRDALVTGLRARGHKQAMALEGSESLAPLIKRMAKPGDYVVSSARVRSPNGRTRFPRN